MAEKTLLLAREEMVQQITDTIIRSGVPLIVIEPVMERMLTEVRAALQQQYLDQWCILVHSTSFRERLVLESSSVLKSCMNLSRLFTLLVPRCLICY